MKYRVGDVVKTVSSDLEQIWGIKDPFTATIQHVDEVDGRYHVVPTQASKESVSRKMGEYWDLHTNRATRDSEPGWWVRENEVIGQVSLTSRANDILEELNVEDQEILE